ncbi:MAG: small, acid-soluble spore protein, alpha/beta type [Bacillota bacterium]|nr:small, acid-soluble spore protein, alpha/beta type [Bacillota bacterium]
MGAKQDQRSEGRRPQAGAAAQAKAGAKPAAAAGGKGRARKDPFAGDGPLARLKLEVARELGLEERVRSSGWGGLTAAETGRLGGWMTRRLKRAESGGESRRGSGSAS